MGNNEIDTSDDFDENVEVLFTGCRILGTVLIVSQIVFVINNFMNQDYLKDDKGDKHDLRSGSHVHWFCNVVILCFLVNAIVLIWSSSAIGLFIQFLLFALPVEKVC